MRERAEVKGPFMDNCWPICRLCSKWNHSFRTRSGTSSTHLESKYSGTLDTSDSPCKSECKGGYGRQNVEPKGCGEARRNRRSCLRAETCANNRHRPNSCSETKREHKPWVMQTDRLAPAAKFSTALCPVDIAVKFEKYMAG